MIEEGGFGPPGDGSEALFTVFQHAGMSDRQFQEDATLVWTELDTLRRLLERPGA